MNIYLRPDERFVRLVDQDDWQCTNCDQEVVECEFEWADVDEGDFAGRPTGRKLRFRDWRHADGSNGHLINDLGNLDVSPKLRCGECKATNLTFADIGYCAVTTCVSCGSTTYSDRGD